MQALKTFFIFFLLCFATQINYAQFAKFTVNGARVNSNAIINTCVNSPVALRNDVSSAYGFQWDLPGGSPSSSFSLTTSVSYALAGTYKVVHTYSVAGNDYADSVRIQVSNTFPMANFSFTPTAIVCGNNNFTFNSGGSSGGPLTYRWDFKDGRTSALANPVHSFTKAVGNGSQTSYDVSLTVTNTGGCSNTTIRTVTVLQVPDITVNTSDESTLFPANSDTVTFRNCDNKASHLFRFTNNSTTIATNRDYTIDWGDGSPILTMADWPTANTLTHSFPRGLTMMTVTVNNPTGCRTVKKYGVFVGSNPSGGFATSGNTTGLCAPSQIDFIINNFQNNGTGTRYIFTVSDGSQPIEMMHPPPSTVSHIFDRSSCGFVSIDGTQNSFYASLRIVNPCEPPTSLTISPILVSGKPNPVIQAPANICVNTAASITHTGGYGELATTTSCNQTGKQVWLVSPTTGVTLNSGNYGSLNGDVLNSTAWTDGARNLNVNFTQPGTYTVKLYMANSRCGVDSTTRTICVRNPPTASFTMEKKEGCAPANVNFTNTSPVGPCGGERYNWTVAYNDTENCGTTSGFNFIGGTTATSKDPQISFTTAGRYIITLSVTAIATGCTAIVATDTFYAKAKPQVVLSAIASVCAGNTISPTATVQNCYSTHTPAFAWQFTGGSPASSANANPGNILYNNNGSFTVNLSVTNECGTTPASRTVNITNKPTANAGPDKEVCSGNATQLGVTGSGFTYSWSPTNFLSNSGIANPTIRPFSNIDTTLEYIVTVSSGANCLSTDTVLVTVKRSPVVTVLPVEISICSGASATLTASGADAYSWSPSTGLNVNNQAVVIASPTNNTNYTVTGRLANGCENTATALVRVVPFSPANAGADRNYCSGKSVTIGSSNQGMNYSWSPATGLSNPSISSPTVNFVYTGNASDTTLQYILTASAGANCSSTDTVLVTVKRTPVVIVDPILTSICSGSSAVLTASGADTYSWSPSAGLNVNNQAVVIASPGNNTNYTVTGTLANNCFSTALVEVRVVAFIPANAGLNKNYCSGQSVVIGTANMGMNYRWSPATGLINAFTAMPTVNFVYTGNASDTTLQYILTASAGANCSSTDTVLITVKRTPIVSVSPMDTDICPGGSVTLTASGADNYTWSPVNGLNTGIMAVVIASPFATQQYTVTGNLANGCLQMTTTTVNVKAKPAVEAGSDVLTCNNYPSIQLTGSPAGGSWNGNNFISPTGVFNPMLAGNGVFKARYNFSLNGCSNADSLFITVTNPPASNAGIDASFCATSATAKLTGLPMGGSWSGSPIVSSTGILQLNNAGIYQLIYSVGTGTCIGADTVQITIGDAVIDNVINAVSAICTGNIPATIIGSMATAGTYPISYQWQQSIDSINWMNINGEIVKDFSPPLLTQTTFYRRIASSTLCAQGTQSLPVKVLVHPNAIASFSPTIQKGCAPWMLSPAIVNLTPYADRNNVYQWFINGSLIGTGEVFPGYTIQNPADSVVLKLIAISRFGCLNDSVQHSFTTVPQPIPSFTMSDSVGCGPLTISFVNTTPEIGKFTYFWDFGNGQTSSLPQPGNILFVINPNYGDTVYPVTMHAITECDTLKVVQFIRVRAQPKALFTPSIVQGCSPMTVNFFNNSRGSNGNFVWDFGDGSPQVPSNGNSISHTFFTGKLDTFYVKLFGSNDCGIDTQQYAIVVNPNTIKLNVAVNGNQVNGCAPHSVLFVNNTVGANLFRWNFGDGSPELTTTKGIDSLLHTYTKTGTYKMTLFATNSCSDTTTTINIFIEVKPVVTFTASPTVLCVGETLQLNNNSETGLTWNWRYGDGTISSLRSPVKSFTAPGNFRIWLVGTKSFAQGFGCSDSAFADITVKDTLPGNFSVDSTSSCSPMTVVFKNLNRPSVNTIWNFGDGSTATGDSVVHVYTIAGSYNVVMVARATGGCLFTHQKVIEVVGPTGELIYRPNFACLGNPSSFEVLSTNTSQYRFYFGNGDSAISASPAMSYTYPNPGVYLPSVQLVTGNCKQLLKGTDTIKIDRLKAGFRSTAALFCGYTQVSFTDTSNAYFGVSKWDWNFGDGTFSSLRNPVKVFTSPGLYHVQLSITGASNCTDIISIPVMVEIKDIPSVAITGDSLACTGNKLALTAILQSVEPVISIQWTFGNGTSATGLNTEVVYANGGLYPVRLISRTAFGCADTATKIIRVNQSPVVFAGTDKRICLGQSTTLNASGAPQIFMEPGTRVELQQLQQPRYQPYSHYRIYSYRHQ